MVKKITRKPAAQPFNEKYEIRKNIPMPGTRIPRADRYPYKKMKVGDSFVVPKEEIATARQSMKIENARLKAEKSKLRFMSRTLTDGALGIWLQTNESI